MRYNEVVLLFTLVYGAILILKRMLRVAKETKALARELYLALFSVLLYSDKTYVFDQSERAQGSIRRL